MGDPDVKTLARRRVRNFSLTLLLFAAVGAAVHLQTVALRDTSALTGWLLVGGFVLLALYNLRKKLPMLPLFDSASWLQVHLYLGLLTAAVFVLHAGWQLPTGRFEGVLWGLSVALFVTGALGIALSRIAPGALTWHGERVIYERIPRLRRELADEVEQLATQSVEETVSGTIAGFYAERLKHYFASPRNRLAHLLGSKRPLHRMCREMTTLERYLTDEGRATLKQIEDCVIAKHNLDFQQTWQGLLKGWLFLHIPLTYAALVAVPVHVVLVYAFAAGTP
jgi:hypothetical protein